MQKTPCDCTVCREIEKPKVIFERGEEARIPVRRSKEISTHFFALLTVTAQFVTVSRYRPLEELNKIPNCVLIVLAMFSIFTTHTISS